MPVVLHLIEIDFLTKYLVENAENSISKFYGGACYGFVMFYSFQKNLIPFLFLQGTIPVQEILMPHSSILRVLNSW